MTGNTFIVIVVNVCAFVVPDHNSVLTISKIVRVLENEIIIIDICITYISVFLEEKGSTYIFHFYIHCWSLDISELDILDSTGLREDLHDN